MEKPLIKIYQSSPIPFLSNGWVNATEMAKAFDTQPAFFLRNDKAKQFIAALQDVLAEEQNPVLQNHITEKNHYAKTHSGQVEVIRQVQGGTPANQGTWMHPLLAVEFARWCSPHFGIWCNRIMLDVLAGKTVTPKRAAELLPGVAGVRDAVDALWAARFSSGSITMRIKAIRGTPTQIAAAITKVTGETHAPNWVGRALSNGVGRARLVRTSTARRYTLNRPA